VSSELEKVVGPDRFEPGLRIASSLPFPNDFRRVWATALALAWLERHAAHLQSEWGMAGGKGRHWLDRALGDITNAGCWVHEAGKLL
jgi:hypothetical protein